MGKNISNFVSYPSFPWRHLRHIGAQKIVVDEHGEMEEKGEGVVT